MSDTPQPSITRRQGLSPAELADVRELARACEEHDRIDLRLGWSALAAEVIDPSTCWLAYHGGMLAGFLGAYGLGDDEAEATGMVHPSFRRQGIFRELVAAARAACRQMETRSILFYVDSRSASAQAFAAAVGAAREFAESKMRLSDAATIPEPTGELAFGPATFEDVPAIAAILAQDMDGNPRHLEVIVARNMQNPIYRYYVGARDGDPVGTLNVQTLDGDPYIYGFVVRPEYRGRGYGREILARALRDLAADRPGPIYLEVEPDNRPAVSLYGSLGFEMLVTYDYYRLTA